MAGIVSYGAYVPLRRLSTGTQSEKAVANWDEDSLTMAVAAAIDCFGDIQRETIDGLYFATTTPPYAEKLAATTAAWATGLRPDIITADITDSLRAGTAALRMAADAVKAGSAKHLLVTAADLRMGSGGMDSGFGDGAAAFLIGDKDVIATIDASYSLSNELLDVWRASGAKQVRSWEDRFVFEEGYLKILPQAVKSFLEKSGITTKDITRAVFYGPDLRRHRQMAGALGFKPEQVQEPFFDKLGNTGAAFVPMMLVAALEDAKPGDKILLASYGDGADVLLLKVTDKIKSITGRWGMKRGLASKMLMRSQGEYIAFREFAASDPEKFGGASASVIARDRDAIYALHGMKCLTCGTVQYPPQRICTQCHTKDNFEPYSFADKKGKVFTFTLKHGADIPGFARPMVDTMVDFEGGGRALFGMTDMIADKVKVGMDVEMSFRTLGAGGGIHNYFWRCMPPRESWLGKETK
jgi:hydroxymethylglutaryl-CoA synthase